MKKQSLIKTAILKHLTAGILATVAYAVFFLGRSYMKKTI